MAEVELQRLGDRAKARPHPTLKGSVAAAGATLMVTGAAIVAGDIAADGGSTLAGVGLGLLAVVAGYFVLIRLPEQVHPAGLAAIALGTPVAIVFLLEDSLDSPALILLVLAVAWGVGYVVPHSRGELVFLVGSLASLWLLLLDVVANDTPGGDSLLGIDGPTGGLFDDAVTFLSLFIGLGLLTAAWALDREDWRGVATGCVIVGDLAFVVGVFGVVDTFESDVAGSMLVTTAGVVLAFVGAAGERRLTTWLGGGGVLIGLGALIANVFDQADAAQFGFSAMALGIAIVAAIAFVDIPVAAATPAPEPLDPRPPIEGLYPRPTAPELEGAGDASPAGWHPDPHGRHQLRWWDGRSWTDQVSDDGATSTDPAD